MTNENDIVELKAMEESIVDNIFKSLSTDRIKSPNWERGFIFSPEFSISGKLLSIYTESDSLFIERIIKFNQ